MRIRTIKPEFWQDERLSALPPLARLLAIALLNAADDAGRFRADARLLAGTLFPFEDGAVAKIEAGLRDLSGIGYVVIYEAEGRACGWVPGFRRHQRVCRPTPSTIPPCIEESQSAHGEVREGSMINHGELNEGSSRERKGKEGNGREGKVPPLPPRGGGDRPTEQQQDSTTPATSEPEPARHCVESAPRRWRGLAIAEVAPEAPESRNAEQAPTGATCATSAPQVRNIDWESAANRFWAAYPPAGKRQGRIAVLSAFRLAVEERHANPDDILAGVQAFAAAVARWPAEEARYIPSATTWLVEERWTADPASWARDKPIAHMHDPRALDGIEADAKRLRENGGKLW